jgi:hypothetical protein
MQGLSQGDYGIAIFSAIGVLLGLVYAFDIGHAGSANARRPSRRGCRLGGAHSADSTLDNGGPRMVPQVVLFDIPRALLANARLDRPSIWRIRHRLLPPRVFPLSGLSRTVLLGAQVSSQLAARQGPANRGTLAASGRPR